MFQSSLELSPECNDPRIGGAVVVSSVSILTRAFARVQPKELYERVVQSRVSILTRAFARVQRGRSNLRMSRRLSFNPHSSFRPSATPAGAPRFQPRQVSILTRAFARVQPT